MDMNKEEKREIQVNPVRLMRMYQTAALSATTIQVIDLIVTINDGCFSARDNHFMCHSASERRSQRAGSVPPCTSIHSCTYMNGTVRWVDQEE